MACYPDGRLSDVVIIVQDLVADISVIKVDRPCPLPNLRRDGPMVGDTVYILGFSPAAGSALNFTKGMVTSTEQASIFTTDAYANHGFSGGQVFNLKMEIVGMVKGGAGMVQGIANQQVRCINVAKVDGIVSGMIALFPESCRSWP